MKSIIPTFNFRFVWYFGKPIYASFNELELFEDEVRHLELFKENFGKKITLLTLQIPLSSLFLHLNY